MRERRGDSACPLCMGAFQQSKAQELVTAAHSVLAVPTADPSRFRVIEVLKGERPASGTIEGGYPRNGPAPGVTGRRASANALLLVRDDKSPHVGQRRCDRQRSRAMAARHRLGQARNRDERRRMARSCCAYAAVPRKPRAAGRRDRIWRARGRTLRRVTFEQVAGCRTRGTAVAERSALAPRQSLYLLLLGIAGDAKDAASLESQLDTAWQGGDATNLGSCIAADLQLRGPARWHGSTSVTFAITSAQRRRSRQRCSRSACTETRTQRSRASG